MEPPSGHGVDNSGGVSQKIKVLVLGDSRVGKSSIVRRILGKPFDPEHLETLGVEVSSLEALSPTTSEAGIVELWTCSGAARYIPIVQQNYRGADLALLIYDMTRSDSFEKCLFWRNEVLRALPDARMILVCNKSDVDGNIQVSEETHDKQGESWGVQKFRTSCKTGEGIPALLNELLRNL